MILGKPQPQSIDSEKAVLASMILDRESLSTCLQTLKKDDFHLTIHKYIFNAIKDIYQNKKPVDLVTIMDYLMSHDLIEKFENPAYISEITRTMTISANIQYYIDIVKEKSLRRSLNDTLTKCMEDCYDETTDINKVIDKVQQNLFNYKINKEEGLVALNTAIPKLKQNMIKRLHGCYGLRTGYSSIDDIIKQIEPSELVFIGASPSVGKTSLALNLAIEFCKQPSLSNPEFFSKVAFYSLETSKDKILKRVLKMITDFGIDKHYTEELINKAFEEYNKLISQMDFMISTQRTINTLTIREDLRKLVSDSFIDVVFIDFIQLMRVVDDSKYGNRNLELESISRELNNIAEEFGVIIICLSQVTAGGKEQFERITMDKLRDSKSLANNASKVFTLWKTEDNYNSKSNIVDVNGYIAKNKEGRAFEEFLIKFDKKRSSFINI